MTQTEVFIEHYKRLERAVRRTYGISDHDSISYFLSHENKFKKFKSEIQYCQEVRNWLQHKEKVNSEFAITPNEAVIRFIDDLIHRVESRSKCKDIYVPFKDVYAQTMQGSVRDSILEMRRHLYTHIPIIENETVVGVFDENSIFNYLAEEGIIAIDEALTFADIIKYIQLEDREMETFEFVNENTYVDILGSH